MAAPRNDETLVVMQPIMVDTVSPDRNGMLVMANGMLVGILVQLSTPDHEHQVGNWFLEAAFGGLQGVRPAQFDSLEEASRWFRHRLKSKDG